MTHINKHTLFEYFLLLISTIVFSIISVSHTDSIFHYIAYCSTFLLLSLLFVHHGFKTFILKTENKYIKIIYPLFLCIVFVIYFCFYYDNIYFKDYINFFQIFYEDYGNFTNIILLIFINKSFTLYLVKRINQYNIQPNKNDIYFNIFLFLLSNCIVMFYNLDLFISLKLSFIIIFIIYLILYYKIYNFKEQIIHYYHFIFVQFIVIFLFTLFVADNKYNELNTSPECNINSNDNVLMTCYENNFDNELVSAYYLNMLVVKNNQKAKLYLAEEYLKNDLYKELYSKDYILRMLDSCSLKKCHNTTFIQEIKNS